LRELAAEEHHPKIRLMREWDPMAKAAAEDAPEVPDPYYGGPKGFEDMHAMLRRSCEKLLDELAHGSAGTRG
jgi:protein-tyrosine phosphatase